MLSGGEKNGSICEWKEDKGQGRKKCVGDNRVLVTYIDDLGVCTVNILTFIYLGLASHKA